jgi:hypothetical protein
MTVQTSKPISIGDIKSGTGMSANDLGSYYRGSNSNTGWTPASGAISYDDLRGAWTRDGIDGFHQPYSIDNTASMYTSYGGYYYYYYTIGQNAYYRGDVWTNSTSNNTYPGGGVTAARAVHTAWYNSTYAGSGYPGATLPMGAIGDTGGAERFVGVSSGCSLSGWYYYFNHYAIEAWAHQSGVGYGNTIYGYYSFIGGGISNWINFLNTNAYGYAFGARINTSGTLHVGKYYVGDFGSSSSPSSVTVSEETAITGSSYLHGRHRQTSISAGCGAEIAGGVTFYFYPRYYYYKNAFKPTSFNTLSGGSTFMGQGNSGWT